MAQADTVLIAVRDRILADSLRFSLELEGFETRVCDERSLFPAAPLSSFGRACLVLDQEVFLQAEATATLAAAHGRPLPAILMVSQKTERVLARARGRGIAEVLENPVLGGLMLQTIRRVIGHAPIAKTSGAS